MTTVTLLIADHATGRVVVDAETDAGRAVTAALNAAGMGAGAAVGCARPLRGDLLHPIGRHAPGGAYVDARIRGIWHDSLIEGPGRRSVVQFQGCPIRCKGCWVPETWAALGGYLIDVESLADAVLDREHERDGVTILGGEPFAQPRALAALIAALRRRRPGIHLCVYTGYTVETLRANEEVDRLDVLAKIDTLIDGPYIEAESGSAGPWTGSGNQRVIE